MEITIHAKSNYSNMCTTYFLFLAIKYIRKCIDYQIVGKGMIRLQIPKYGNS